MEMTNLPSPSADVDMTADVKEQYRGTGKTYRERNPEAEEMRMDLDAKDVGRFNSTGDDIPEVEVADEAVFKRAVTAHETRSPGQQNDNPQGYLA